MQKVSIVTLCAGCHSLKSGSSEPMKNLPPGTSTMPEGHSVRRAAAAADAGGAALAIVTAAADAEATGALRDASSAGDSGGVGAPRSRLHATAPPAASATATPPSASAPFDLGAAFAASRCAAASFAVPPVV